MRKSLDQYAREWKKNAEADPLWVILTDQKYYGKKWDLNDFFATGDVEIERLFNFMKQQDISVPLGSFLDFGCGVGRASKALKRRFIRGFGVDISQRMTELARQYVEDVQFIVNTEPSLSAFQDDSIDFIYSHLVLQHIPNEYSLIYIDELLRILKPEGVAVLQIPSQVINEQKIAETSGSKTKKMIKRLFPFLVTAMRRFKHQDSLHDICIEMHTLSSGHIESLCSKRGCIIEAVAATNSCDTDHEGKIEFLPVADQIRQLRQAQQKNMYLSSMYFIRKPDGSSSEF